MNNVSVIALRSIGKWRSVAPKVFSLPNLSPPVHQQHFFSYTVGSEQESQLLVKNLTENACQTITLECQINASPLLVSF